MFHFFIYKLNKKIQRLEKRNKLSLYFLSPLRILHMLIEKTFMSRNLEKLSSYGGYFMRKEKYNKINVVSAGIGDNCGFEQEIIKKLPISKLITIDPTNEGKKCIKKIKSKKIFFEQKALFTHNGNIKIFLPFDEKKNFNLSIDNLYSSNKFKIIKSINMESIIKKYNLKIIDILKLDIEGVADIVILDYLKKKQYPDQILFEIERPYSVFKQLNFFYRFIKLLYVLRKNYKIYVYNSLKLGFKSEISAIKIK
jgi:FkbM family methyltransferase